MALPARLMEQETMTCVSSPWDSCFASNGSAAETMVENTKLWSWSVPWSPCLLFRMSSWRGKHLFLFQEVSLDFLPQTFGSMLSKRLLWFSTISTSRKEIKSKGWPHCGTVHSTEPCPDYAAHCHDSCRMCRMAGSVSLMFGSYSEVS